MGKFNQWGRNIFHMAPIVSNQLIFKIIHLNMLFSKGFVSIRIIKFAKADGLP